MRWIINLVLIALAGLLTYLIVDSIREPIQFQNELNARKELVVRKMIEVREAQQAYRGITGTFAPNFDTLKQVLSNGKFEVISIFGDRDAGEQIRRETSYVTASDSIKKIKVEYMGFQKVGITLDSLEYVPLSNGEKFELKADTITYQQARGLPVLEVRTPYKAFMGKYADPRYKKYDKTYNPDKPGEKNYYLKFGDMEKPSTSGNWE